MADEGVITPEQRAAAVRRILCRALPGAGERLAGCERLVDDVVAAAIRDAEAPLRARVAELEAELKRVAPLPCLDDIWSTGR